MIKLTDFMKGLVVGVVASVVVFGAITLFWFFRNRDREAVVYAERKIEVQAMREDYINRDPVEFLGDIPGVRGAADGAAAEFLRKRDEAMERFRNRLVD